MYLLPVTKSDVKNNRLVDIDSIYQQWKRNECIETKNQNKSK